MQNSQQDINYNEYQLSIQLYSRTVNITVSGKKRSFQTFYTRMNIVVAGEEEKGKQKKWITVKFRKHIDTSKFKYGKILCNPDDVNIPYKYRIVDAVDEDGVKNGKKEYPVIWIRNVNKYIEEVPPKREVKQSDFIENEQDTNKVEFNESEDEKVPF